MDKKKGAGIRTAAAILITVLLFTMSGCAFFDKIHTRIDPRASRISSPEIVRNLVMAINDPAAIGDAFEAIPESQRKDISYSYFYEYISIISSIGSSRAKIESFEYLDSEENKLHLEKIYNKVCQKMPTGTFEETFEPYGDLHTVRLIRSGNEDEDIFIYISEDENKDAYISANWVMHTIAIYNYIEHYFNMLNSLNSEGIAVLIENKPEFKDIYSPEIILAKADYTVDFYNYKVKGSTDQFVLTSINAFFVDYLIPEVLSNEGQQIYSRHVGAFRKTEGDIEITDDIPQELDNSLITLNVSLGQMLRCGVEYDNSAITRMLGKPVRISVIEDNINTVTDTEGNEITEKKISVQYKGVHLIFDAYFKADGSWSGKLIGIKLVRNSKVSYSACDIKLGDPEDSILKRFPMIKYGEYDLEYSNTTGKYVLSYFVKDGAVSDIYICKVE